MEYENLKHNLLEYLRLKTKKNLSCEEVQIKDSLYHSFGGYTIKIDGEDLLDLGEEIKEVMEESVMEEVYAEVKERFSEELREIIIKSGSNITRGLELLAQKFEETIK